MDNLPFIAKHNLVAFLDSAHARAMEFQEVFNFLRHSNLNHAISTDVLIYREMIQEFWSNVHYNIIEGIPTLTSLVQESQVIVTEEVIRRVLQLNDAGGIEEIPFEEIQLICRNAGYERDFPGKMVKKTRFSYNWRYIAHVLIHCLSSRQGGFDEMGQTLASGFACLITGRVFNFSAFLFENLRRHLQETQKKFLLYPRFLQIILNSEVEGLMPEGEVLIANNMTWKIMGNMRKNFPATGFSGRFTPFFPHMLHQDPPPPPIVPVQPQQPPQSPPQLPPQLPSPQPQSPPPPSQSPPQPQQSPPPQHQSSTEEIDVLPPPTSVASSSRPIVKVFYSRRRRVSKSSETSLRALNTKLKDQVSQQQSTIISLKLTGISHLMLISALKGELQHIKSNPVDDASKMGGDFVGEDTEIARDYGEEEEADLEGETIIIEDDDDVVVSEEVEEVENLKEKNRVEEEKDGFGDLEGNFFVNPNISEEYGRTGLWKAVEEEKANEEVVVEEVVEEEEIVEEAEVEVEGVGPSVTGEVEKEKEITSEEFPRTTRKKQVARKVTPHVVREIQNKLSLWKRSLDDKHYRKQLKSYLVDNGKFENRSVGQMKIETLEKHVIELATQEKLTSMRSEREKDRAAVQFVLQKRKRREEESTSLEDSVPEQVEVEIDAEGQRHINELQDWLEHSDSDGSDGEYVLKKRKVVEESGSRMVTPSNEELKAERIRLEEIKKGISVKIKGWRFDAHRNAIVIKRVNNQCTYFDSTEELMKLKKDDLVQLSKLKMVNHGMYPHGSEFEQFVKKHAATNFMDFNKKLKRRRSTMTLDRVPIPFTKKKKNEKKPRVIGWRMDCEAHEIVIEREDGSEDRLYEDADLRELSNTDIITLSQLPFRNHENYEDGEHFLKVIDFCVECIRANVR